MKATNKISGPIPLDEFRALANAPHGQALKVIRKHDPLFGLGPDAKIVWDVTFERDVIEEGYATVKAGSEEEARALAGKLKEQEISWDASSNNVGDFELTGIEPSERQSRESQEF